MQDVRKSVYAGSPLDRTLPLPDAPAIDPLYLILSPTLQILHHYESPAHSSPTLFYSASLASALLSTSPHPPSYFLGTHAAHIYHAIHLSAPPPSTLLPSLPTPASFAHLRSLTPSLAPPDAAIAAHARSLADFHQRHLFCGLCGAATEPDRLGTRRRCARNTAAPDAPTTPLPPTLRPPPPAPCSGVVFPRSDPVAIMLVVDARSRRALLAHQPRFPARLFSCLAGFMEHGEGVEDAVRRETREEAGVRVGRVRFFGSQPWPFPYSLMLGCVAQAVTEDIEVDGVEVEEARWFSRQQVQEMVQRAGKGGEEGDRVPPEMSVAGLMCAAFAEGDPVTIFDDGQGEGQKGML